MDYSLRDHTLYLTDDGTTSLSSFRLRDSDLFPQGHLLKLLGDTITAMALDWVTLNIYWSSNKQLRLQVTSITAAHTAVLIKEGIGRVESIALHPSSGRVCFTNLGPQGLGTMATVECAHMDGAGRRVVWKDAVQPASVTFSSNGDTIYWADTGKIFFLSVRYSMLYWLKMCFHALMVKNDAEKSSNCLDSLSGLGTIGSVQLDGSGYRELKAGDGLAAVALSDDTLLWMTVSGNGLLCK